MRNAHRFRIVKEAMITVFLSLIFLHFLSYAADRLVTHGHKLVVIAVWLFRSVLEYMINIFTALNLVFTLRTSRV